MTQRNFYQVLGVERDAAPGEVRAAYTRLARRHHPDIAGELPERLRDIQQAYRCLSDAGRRAEHDRALVDDERRHFARQRSIQRRLQGYDRRHPQAPLRIRRRWRWQPMLVATIGVAVVVRLSVGLFG
jgi:DnaJ-class molecular chaperone